LAAARLYPVLVQGSGAAAEIRQAIEAANRHGWAELLIVGRGGGSLEDLVAFNDESVARAVFSSAIPVVSAVGHETDFSICDFVADLRAPTPSAAAELATPDQAVLKEAFARAGRQLARRTQTRLQRDSQRLDHLAHRLQQRHPATRLAEQARRLRQLSAALPRLALDAIRTRRQRLSGLARTLHAVSPLEVIGRGYAVLIADGSDTVVSSIRQVNGGDRVAARLKDGSLHCIVDSVTRDPG
jgi:exodeoxyribonuclease VII large subunit